MQVFSIPRLQHSPLCILINSAKPNVSSNDFQKKILSRTDFEMENFILETNFMDKNE
tara:strand:+ start:4217 stop:4387 length:171 start_codon:yes stop_codon:yes gene_type:complete